jgi:hypothetical protein
MRDFQHHMKRPSFSGNMYAAGASKPESSQEKWAASPIPAIPVFHKPYKTCSIKPAGRSRVKQLRQ